MKTQLKQHPERDVHEQAYAILAAGRLAHVGFIDGEQPYVVPMSYQYDRQEPESLYLHGALQSRALQIASSGAPLCIEVSLLDGLVYSRTALYHSMNYRSVMGFGRGEWIEDQATKDRILAEMVQRYFPGRKSGADYAPPPAEHLQATGMVRVNLHQVTAKARTGGPKGPEDQSSGPGTAGVIPTSGCGLTFHQDAFTISTDPTQMDLAAIHTLLRKTYWATELQLDQLQIAVEHSLCFGLFHQGRQIGFTRVVTDWVGFAYLADVVIDESYRGQDLGKWLMHTILNYPGLENMRRWLLKTMDAQPFYALFGFTSLAEPEKFMEKTRNQSPENVMSI